MILNNNLALMKSSAYTPHYSTSMRKLSVIINNLAKITYKLTEYVLRWKNNFKLANMYTSMSS